MASRPCFPKCLGRGVGRKRAGEVRWMRSETEAGVGGVMGDG
ncbi:MAG: hypothetical protein QXX19_08830 [Candidatus Caldarchaeum sp.]